MQKRTKIVGLMLARFGSKGVPMKNIRELNDKPLMAYVLEEAKKSKYLDDLYVSSEERLVRLVAEKFGAKTIITPGELSNGDKPIECIQHFLANVDCDIIVLLNACCPLTKVEDIDACIEVALDSGCDSVTSLLEDFSSHPTKLCHLDGNKVEPLGRAFATAERQKLEPTYKRNTAIYLMKREVIEQGKLFGDDTRGYIMPKERSWDINDMWDWQIAEFLTKSKNG